MATQVKPHSFANWKVADFQRVIDRMIDRHVTQGPGFTLKDIVVAQSNHPEVRYSPWKLMLDIAANSEAHPTRQLSYLDLWRRYNEGDFPGGYGPIKPITTQLETVTGVCETYGLPFLSILIVGVNSGELSKDAKAAFWRDWGNVTSSVRAADENEFAEQMTGLALNVTVADLEKLV